MRHTCRYRVRTLAGRLGDARSSFADGAVRIDCFIVPSSAAVVASPTTRDTCYMNRLRGRN